MYKGKDIIGKPVVSYNMGEKFDTVEDLIFDQDSNQLVGFLVEESGWFTHARVLLLKDVQSIGVDAVITVSKDAIVDASQIPAVDQILKHNNILKGTHILTMNGRDLGTIIDLYFDEQNGKVEGYEVSGGLFADAYSGRSFVPALQTLKIGRDVAFVPTETAQLMEEQVGGIKGAMQTVGDRVQDAAHVTGDKLQELGQVAGEKAQETAHLTGDKFQELGRSTTTSMTNALVGVDAQKAFAMGKIVDRDVIAPEGQLVILQGQIVTEKIANQAQAWGMLDALYRAAGGRLSDSVGERVSHAMAGLAIEQAQGRRIRQVLRTDEGSILAAPGQIVTTPLIERVRDTHQEYALLQAVGLSTEEALRDRTGITFSEAGDRFRTTSQSTGEQFQSGARGFWERVKEVANNLQDRGTQAIEEKRIKSALGRPTTRVILDEQDEVILNVGELITHQAIASARHSGVLDLLLSSVYGEKPKLVLEDLRAPQAGSAAL